MPGATISTRNPFYYPITITYYLSLKKQNRTLNETWQTDKNNTKTRENWKIKNGQ